MPAKKKQTIKNKFTKSGVKAPAADKLANRAAAKARAAKKK